MAFNTFRNMGRLNKIVRTLIRYRFGDIVSEIKLLPLLSAVDKVIFWGRKGKGLSVAVRLRMVLEELGPTFIKLGQVASTRADVLPVEWIEEFKKLQDSVPPFSFDEVRVVVEKSLGATIGDKFSTFDEAPVASASIAQVHLATLKDGREVAVKVKRPGIDTIIESDLSVMMFIARLLRRYVPAAKRYRPIEVVKEFGRIIRSEQDLAVEGANLARFHRIFKDNPDVDVPEVYWEYSSSSVLTMARIEGVPIDEVEAIAEYGVDIKEVAVRGIAAFFEQVFEHRVFHADLHPGNIFVGPRGNIIYLDFGIVGRLDRDLARYLATMLFHLIKRDYRRMATVHREMGLISKSVDIDEFEDTLRDISEPMFGKSLEHIDVSALLMKLILTAKRFNMVLQPNLLLLQKSMVIIEGVGRQLYPGINMWEVAKPLIYKWMIKEKVSPKSVIGKGKEGAREAVMTIGDVPFKVNTILERTINEELRIGFVHHRLEVLSGEVRVAGGKISGGLVAGALFLGSLIFAAFGGGEGGGGGDLWGVPVLSLLGFAGALAITIKTFSLRSDREEE